MGDPRKPAPKPAEKKEKKPEAPRPGFLTRLFRKIVALVLIAALGLAAYSTWVFKRDQGRWPQDKADGMEVARIWLEHVRLGYERGREQVAAIDWNAIASRITDQTRSLYDRAAQLMERPAPTPPAEMANGGSPQAGGAAPETAAIPTPEARQRYYEEYRAGYEAMREGARHYRGAMPGMPNADSEREEAKRCFEESRTRLVNADRIAREDGGEPDPELNDTIVEVQTYISDCNRMTELGGH